MKPAKADSRFHAPMGRQVPLVTVRQANTVKFALITVRLHVVAKEADAADIVIGILGVETEEMTGELFTKPVAGFGLDHPVFETHAVAKLPGVVVGGDIESPLRSESHFDAEVERGRNIIKDIRFYRELTGRNNRRSLTGNVQRLLTGNRHCLTGRNVRRLRLLAGNGRDN